MFVKTTFLALFLGTLPLAEPAMKYLATKPDAKYLAAPRLERGNYVLDLTKRRAFNYLGLDTLHELPTDSSEGRYPTNSMIVGMDGNLYGTTGGYNDVSGLESVFYKQTATGSWVTPTTNYTVLHHFNDGSVANDGFACYGKLAQDTSSGYIYGTCQEGGAYGYGTVYQIDPSNGAVTILHSFGSIANDGYTPVGGLVVDGSGNLYGSTAHGAGSLSCSGGSAYCGTLFQLTPLGGGSYSYSILHCFDLNSEDPHSLTLASDGNLYGTTIGGGANGEGIYFKYDFGYNSLLKLLDVPSGGDTEWASLTEIPASFTGGPLEFWGTAVWGGGTYRGIVYKIADTTGNGDFKYTVMHGFSMGVNEGYAPWGDLVFSTDLRGAADAGGALYGTTYQGGASGHGSLFRIDLSGSFWEFPNDGQWHGLYPSHSAWGLVESSISSVPVLMGSSVYGGANGTGWLWHVWFQ